MKKYLSLLLIVPFLVSCDEPSREDKYLPFPENTNLEFFITQRVTADDFASCQALSFYVGGTEYLDSRYEAVYLDGDTSGYTAPDVHVTYRVTGYPDLADMIAVTGIHITDPMINVYGLTMDSTSEEIETAMKEEGFSKIYGSSETWSKSNCYFYFSTKAINIYATVTNNTGIIY